MAEWISTYHEELIDREGIYHGDNQLFALDEPISIDKLLIESGTRRVMHVEKRNDIIIDEVFSSNIGGFFRHLRADYGVVSSRKEIYKANIQWPTPYVILGVPSEDLDSLAPQDHFFPFLSLRLEYEDTPMDYFNGRSPLVVSYPGDIRSFASAIYDENGVCQFIELNYDELLKESKEAERGFYESPLEPLSDDVVHQIISTLIFEQPELLNSDELRTPDKSVYDKAMHKLRSVVNDETTAEIVHSIRRYIEDRLKAFDSYNSTENHDKEKIVDYFTIDVFDLFADHVVYLVFDAPEPRHQERGTGNLYAGFSAFLFSTTESANYDTIYDVPDATEKALRYRVFSRHHNYFLNLRDNPDVAISTNQGELYLKKRKNEFEKIGVMNKEEFAFNDAVYNCKQIGDFFVATAKGTQDKMSIHLMAPVELKLDKKSPLLDPDLVMWQEHAYKISSRVFGGIEKIIEYS